VAKREAHEHQRIEVKLMRTRRGREMEQSEVDCTDCELQPWCSGRNQPNQPLTSTLTAASERKLGRMVWWSCGRAESTTDAVASEYDELRLLLPTH
jgi:hypothetical protein